MKKDVRYQVFVTAEMDDKVSDLATIMGLTKNELVRVAVATYVGQWASSVQIVKEKFLEQGGEWDLIKGKTGEK